MEQKETIEITGMTCSSCATTVKKSLQNDGLDDVDVNYLTGEATFRHGTPDKLEQAYKHIHRLGYHVVKSEIATTGAPAHHGHDHGAESGKKLERKFYLSLFFTIPVVLHMVLTWPVLHLPLFQLLCSLPVMIIGWQQFGRSALMSLRTGAPNMDVLIALGSTAAFIYSLVGMFYSNDAAVHRYLFFETGDTIITLVLLGNLIESRSVKQTTSAIRELGKLQPEKANLITTNGDGSETVTLTDSVNLKKGDLFLVNTGEHIPTDGIVTWGRADVNESMISGESLPVNRLEGQEVTGGTLVQDGSIKIRVTYAGDETFLARTIALVKNAQLSKPDIQKLGDRISNIFVPVVVILSLLTFVGSLFLFQKPFEQSLLSAIAVLVISCPCAMGLATPTAVMVGLGHAARHGILIKGGDTLENFAKIKTVVFDKTGTLTTGNFRIKKITPVATETEDRIKAILYSLEKYSSHPIAKSMVLELKDMESSAIQWKSVSEDKGIGMNGYDSAGNLYSAGSWQIARHLSSDDSHEIYLLINNQLVATVDIGDEIKPGVREMIEDLKKLHIHPVMISGDRKKNCDAVAAAIGIQEVYAEQLPAEKLRRIEEYSATSLTAMVGDGINDAPALARASVGVSLSDASRVAIQASQVILVPGDNPGKLIQSIRISRATLNTIRQNLFWALAYNIVAIPVAAMGYLSPMIGALSMAFSDVVVIGNSLRLRTKKIF